jgi:uncharacterized protein (DUF4415 family)
MSDSKSKLDADTAALLASLERGLQQAAKGEFAAVHTPETITAKRRGRPVGSKKAEPKQAISLRLDAQTLSKWRATGRGWQTRAAQVLASHVA